MSPTPSTLISTTHRLTAHRTVVFNISGHQNSDAKQNSLLSQ